MTVPLGCSSYISVNSMSIPGRAAGVSALPTGANGYSLESTSLRQRVRPQRHSASSIHGASGGGLGGISLGLAGSSFSHSTEFATSPFGGERSFLLSVSHENRASEPPLASASYPRRAHRRLTGLLSPQDGPDDLDDGRGDPGDDGVDGDGSELGYDDFQPDFFPSSLDELLTPSELEKRRRREPADLGGSAPRPGFLLESSSLGMSHLKDPLRPLPLRQQSMHPLQQHWRSSALSPVSPLTRGVPASMPNHSSLADYDRFDLYATNSPAASTTPNHVGAIPASPGGWPTSDLTLPTTPVGTVAGVPLTGTSASIAAKTVGGPVSSATTPGAEGRFSFHLDDDVPFRMDDISEPPTSASLIGGPLLSPGAERGLSTLPDLGGRHDPAPASDGLAFRLAGLRLGAGDRSTASTEGGRWA
ncbi:hypothetical protein THASP1DRAFT_33030 [Thamnocephalis sphaerospora]|uniref:Uncharacterized protein n=1 Tax=Thamnocephalis sphaerospora TaxID=78915 RepID=A0A4P9XHJ2_9FUNG|nr:hypothetical protein THASP1DRAFT_33030 [Thamnocephalis sphaerospora]|eukprot:RKP05128.1 hypothetical protein THASP1DRAFT_33030 [Thamnocephalis sphaerospora]